MKNAILWVLSALIVLGGTFTLIVVYANKNGEAIQIVKQANILGSLEGVAEEYGWPKEATTEATIAWILGPEGKVEYSDQGLVDTEYGKMTCVEVHVTTAAGGTATLQYFVDVKSRTVMPGAMLTGTKVKSGLEGLTDFVNWAQKQR